MSANPGQQQLPPIEEVPAAHLEGRDLGNGWTVGELVSRDPSATGGAFSISYTVSNRDGHEAFLKALNFQAALAGAGTLVDRLNRFTEAYIFERDLLAECGARRMSRVIPMLEAGEIDVPEASTFLRSVPYLIFELADGDVRSFQSQMESLDAAWALRVVKHTLEGVEQLHAANAAHQDLKPSNVLTQLGGTEMKLGDLGRAERRTTGGPWTDWEIPGALMYAPPEQLYGSFSGTWEERRASDMYLAGSLGGQLFLGHSMSALLQDALAPQYRVTGWPGTFTDVLPALKRAHAEVLDMLEADVLARVGHEDIASNFATAIGQLTQPDPATRGHPKDIRSRTSSYSVRRFVGTMNTLSAQARIRQPGAD